jgi:hypothetical protein
MNDDVTNTTNTDPDFDQDKKAIAAAFRAVGSAWARYGLTVGRAALESSAKSLQVTATALGQLAEAIDNRAHDAAQNPPKAKPEERKDDRTIVVQSGG